MLNLDVGWVPRYGGGCKIRLGEDKYEGQKEMGSVPAMTE